MMQNKIFVTKAFLPPIHEFESHVHDVFNSGQLTNLGNKHRLLESSLNHYFGINNLVCVSNGTIALQLIFKLFEKGEIITTPFSYVATTNSILWEGFIPRFADIDPITCCADPKKVENLINENTKAIVVTHVYGIPCDVEAFDAIGKKYNIPIVYDAAHSFGVKYKNDSILSYGDFSTLSFHATKLFHSAEGGAIVSKNPENLDRISLFRSFGHIGENHFDIGINAKMSELHAAMGLTVLPYVDGIIELRKKATELYDSLLFQSNINRPKPDLQTSYNYSYFPIIFSSFVIREKVFLALENNNIFARRYFSPSLNKLPYFKGESCPISEDIASRILCLPLFHDLSNEDIERICKVINPFIL